MTDITGKTIVNDFTDVFCLRCISECHRDGLRSVRCSIDGSNKHISFTNDCVGKLYICDDKERTSRNFLTLVELIKHCRPSIIKKYKEVSDEAKRNVMKEIETFKHNIIHINSDSLNEFYAIVTQDYLVKNYRMLQDVIDNTIKKKPKEITELLARLIRYSLNLKTELSVISKLDNPDSTPKYATGNPRDAIMTNVYMLYPIFKKRDVFINVSDYWDKFDIDYDALQVASFYIVENASKYCEKGSEVNISFVRDHNRLNIEFDMQSLYIDELDEQHIFEQGFQGVQARQLKHDGRGIGLYRAKLLTAFFEGSLTVEAGAISHKGSNGYDYAGNKFIIEIPIRQSI